MEAEIYWHYTCPICGKISPSNFGCGRVVLCNECKNKEEVESKNEEN